MGAQVRVIYGERTGPVREIQAGSGYWSQNGSVQVLGLPGVPMAVWVRWVRQRSPEPVPSEAAEVVVKR